MSADAEMYGLRFKWKNGKKITKEDKYSVGKLFLEAIFGEDDNDYDEAVEELFESGIYYDQSVIVSSKEEVGYIELKAGEEIYGDVMEIAVDIVDTIADELPDCELEVHWLEYYGGLSDNGWYYDGSEVLDFGCTDEEDDFDFANLLDEEGEWDLNRYIAHCYQYIGTENLNIVQNDNDDCEEDFDEEDE